MPSTVIRAFSYDADARRLDIVFVTGRRYSYVDVPAAVVDAMRRAAPLRRAASSTGGSAIATPMFAGADRG